MKTANIPTTGLYRPGEINADCVRGVLDQFKPDLVKFLRGRDGTASAYHLAAGQFEFAFEVYLRYLSHYKFRYTLKNNLCFWAPGRVSAPEGNCQTVAQNFLDLLWALSVDPRNLFTHRVDIDGVRGQGRSETDLEKIVTKPLDLVDDGKVSRRHRHLLGKSKGTRCFRADKATGRLEAITDHPRNPFRFHVFCYVPVAAGMPYFDARTGLRYKTGGTDYFQGYQRGQGYAYLAGRRAAPGAPACEAEMFYDPARPARRIYRTTDEMDRLPAVRAAVGAYDDGGNWIFTTEADWAGGPAPRADSPPPEHVKRLYTGHVFRWRAQDLAGRVRKAAVDGLFDYNRQFPKGQTVIKRMGFEVHNKTTGAARVRALENTLDRLSSPNVPQVLDAAWAFFTGSTSWKDGSLNLLVARHLVQEIRAQAAAGVTSANARSEVDSLFSGLHAGTY